MTEDTKDKIINVLFAVMCICATVFVITIAYNIGKVVGFQDAYKTQIEEDIRLLEQTKQELLKHQIENVL